MNESRIIRKLFLRVNWIEKCIWSSGIEDLIAVHDSNEVLGVGDVDYVVGIAREHNDGLNLVATYLILDDSVLANSDVAIGFKFLSFRFHVWIFRTKLNQSMT